MSLALALAALLTAFPASAQENPPNLFNEDGSYNMAVACPLWERGLNEDPDRLLICIRALQIKAESVVWQNGELRKRIDQLEQLIMALGKDVSNLYSWSHCHGTQGECAALRAK